MDFQVDNTITNQTCQTRWSFLAVLSVTALLTGFLGSKVVSNIGFFFAGIFVLANFKKTYPLWKNYWILSFLALPTVVILTDLYWNGFDFISGRGLMKCVLILLPVFIWTWKPDKKWVRIVNYGIIAVMAYSTIFSLWLYFNNMEMVHLDYKVAKVLRVLAYKDHIRISWMTVISCLIAFYQIVKGEKKYVKYLLIGYILIQFVFLHILGSKTGLIMLYFSIFIVIVYYLLKERKYRILWFLPLFLLLPYLAYQVMPSFQQRVNYTIYDFSFYIKGEYREGLSDAIRFNSLKAGLDIVKADPVSGVGFINLHRTVENWYEVNTPEIPLGNRFLPISQVIVYWAGGGLIGLLILLANIFIPFFYRELRNNVFFLAYFIPVAVSLLYETHFETQLSLFVYGFMTGWFWYLAKIDFSH
ncbi:MAG: hypothetical protein IPM42_08485 [Saprospiraceae bacterium]|nr:hypothetical protein [Saprospiraceae bacterium]